MISVLRKEMKTKYKIKTTWKLKLALPRKFYELKPSALGKDVLSNDKRLVFKKQELEVRTLPDYVPNLQFFIQIMLKIYNEVDRK